jgi:hypothetical protein
MLVLACSYKLGGRCIAGLSLDEDRLVRPVAPTPERTLHLDECGIDGRYPRLCEVVSFDVLGGDDLPSQPENVVVGDDWRFEETLSVDQVRDLVTDHLHPGGTLFGNNGTAVKHYIASEGIDSSLALVIVSEPTFLHDQSTSGAARVKVSFVHNGHDIALTCTDPALKALVGSLDPGSYSAEDVGLGAHAELLLTLSLAGENQDWHTKLVAGVIPL